MSTPCLAKVSRTSGTVKALPISESRRAARPIVPARRTAGRQATARTAQAARHWHVAAAPARAWWDEWLQSRCGRALYRHTENVYSVSRVGKLRQVGQTRP